MSPEKVLWWHGKRLTMNSIPASTTHGKPGCAESRTRTVYGTDYTISAAHPEAERYPWMPDDELEELAQDILTNGQDKDIERLPDGQLIDGRNRELACLIAAVEPRYITLDIPRGDIRGYVRSANVHRRHLSREMRREMIAEALRENASRSNRDIAKTVGASKDTVAKVRQELVSGGDISHLTNRTGRDGKTYTRKPRPEMPSHVEVAYAEADGIVGGVATEQKPADWVADGREAGEHILSLFAEAEQKLHDYLSSRAGAALLRSETAREPVFTKRPVRVRANGGTVERAEYRSGTLDVLKLLVAQTLPQSKCAGCRGEGCHACHGLGFTCERVPQVRDPQPEIEFPAPWDCAEVAA